MSQYERLREEKRDAKYTEWAKSPKTSTADWKGHRTRGQKIGDYYRHKRGERIYEERYLEYDNTT